MQEGIARLSTWMPFAQACILFAWFTGGHISRETARTITEQAGAAAVAVTEHANAAWEAGTHEPPPGPDTLIVSVDGAMVPLVGGVWGEVKTLTVGEVIPLNTPPSARPDQTVTTSRVTTFSRMTDSTTFGDQALDALQRRGIETAGRVGAVVDGAEWIQGFIDLHAPDAIRILDFPHAAAYVQTIGVTTNQDEGTIAAARHDLKHLGAAVVLPTLRRWVVEHPTPDATLRTALAYLEKRADQMDYPRFQAAGWPIGSGTVESANKLVVEARLKGSGMHWARAHVNPMLALRNAVCNDQWDELWGQIAQQLRQDAAERKRERAQQCRAAKATKRVPEMVPMEHVTAPPPLPPVPVLPDPPQATSPAPPKPKADHPWRRAWSARRQQEMANAA
jgi:hypothetical protein